MWEWIRTVWRNMSGGTGKQSGSPGTPAKSSQNSAAALPKHLAAPGLAEARTLKNLATLDAETRRLAERLVGAAWEELKIDLRVTSGTRTMAQQQALYDQGRTKPGKIVTKARPGYSWHNFGVAFDVTVFKGSTPVWDGPEYDAVGMLGQRLGLEWGGAWTTFKDRPHFQLRMGMTLAEARARWGGEVGRWEGGKVGR